ncbi:hypothetical protein NTGHW29_190036 [Candidatus Nitrotoga sp. HW29]|nr:hypothetical protein NTGHW29_190036 [Candidatus Nitrotoga sp. HW29]
MLATNNKSLDDKIVLERVANPTAVTPSVPLDKKEPVKIILCGYLRNPQLI